jgi:hypothetical protein
MIPRINTLIISLILGLRSRLASLRANPDAGYTTETVIITAFVAGLAITFGAILGPKVINAINSIQI